MLHMLGGRNTHALINEPHRNGPKDKWKADVSSIRENIRYAFNTGRLDYGEARRREEEEEYSGGPCNEDERAEPDEE